jgi:TatD DNase family protein
MIPFIDTHAHLSQLASRGIPVEERLNELFREGFGGIIDIGTGADDLKERIDAFAGFERVRFSAGIWPSAEAIARRGELAALLEGQLSAAPRRLIAAVGECGLDRHSNKAEAGADIRGERELLELQLELAKKLGLPIIIHSREAPGETAEILSAHPEVRGLIHCFSYGKAEARIFLDLDCYISFAGNLTYKNAGELREALCVVPSDRLLLETDAPYLAPMPYRGKPSDPGMVAETYKLAAELRGTDLETLGERIKLNVRDFFSLSFEYPAL